MEGVLSANLVNHAIDIRRIVTQVKGVIDGATLASFLIALLLVIAGALSGALLVASDVDARRREALVFSIVGASRREEQDSEKSLATNGRRARNVSILTVGMPGGNVR